MERSIWRWVKKGIKRKKNGLKNDCLVQKMEEGFLRIEMKSDILGRNMRK